MTNSNTPADGRTLDGQVAVVTGASRGLGRAYATALARAGASVALAARALDPLEALAEELGTYGVRTLALPVEVTDAAAVGRATARVIETLGAVDLLVNAAGLGTPMGPFAEGSVETWWRTLEVNLKGPALWSRALLPTMLARRRGRIVNLASIAGYRAIPNWSAYATSKAALIRLSENLALEAASAGVRVFAVHPGTVRTDMTETALRSGEAARWVPTLAGIFERGQETTIDESAAFVLRIARGDADALSGRFITVSDDLAALTELAASGALGDALSLRMVQPAPVAV